VVAKKVKIAVGLIGILAIAAFSDQRQRSLWLTDVCKDRLMQIETAKEQWRIDYQKTTNDVPTLDDVQRYFKEELVCAAGGKYTIGKLNERPRCSIPRHRLSEP
jgi:hypothetical protein